MKTMIATTSLANKVNKFHKYCIIYDFLNLNLRKINLLSTTALQKYFKLKKFSEFMCLYTLSFKKNHLTFSI